MKPIYIPLDAMLSHFASLGRPQGKTNALGKMATIPASGGKARRLVAKSTRRDHKQAKDSNV